MYDPFSLTGIAEDARLKAPVQIIETKATERNLYLTAQGSKTTGSYFTLRVPGSQSKLVMMEFNTEAGSPSVKHLKEEAGWMSKLMQPIMILCMLGLACYISYSTVKKKND